VNLLVQKTYPRHCAEADIVLNFLNLATVHF